MADGHPRSKAERNHNFLCLYLGETCAILENPRTACDANATFSRLVLSLLERAWPKYGENLTRAFLQNEKAPDESGALNGV